MLPEQFREAPGRCCRRRSGAEGQYLAVLLLREQVDPADRLVRVTVGDGVEQGEQPLLVRGEVVVAVRLRGAVQPEKRGVAVPVVEDPDGQVGGGPRHEVVNRGGMPGEARPGVEGHDVDDQRERGSDAAGRAEVAQQVLAAVALVRDGRLDLPGRLGDEIAPRHLRSHGQAQGHHVGQGAGYGHQVGAGASTGGDGESEHHVLSAAQPVGVKRCRRDHHPGPPDTGPARRGPQCLGAPQFHFPGHAQRPVRVGRGRVGEPGRGGQVGEALGPVGAVGGEVHG
ncbi:hypothetical protein EES39_32260 [Streptomyces sp. ADI92-24]|nr:hypothetical protein EES39_32260 [Streptomyces sp. ADI92-24]